ncbi:MAG TPA: hypothetical protein VF472_02835 [Burkholderiaceae bacterium]
MGRKVVPVKTKEGTQEIRARALGLAPRIRTALLLVDGVKSMDELERLMDAAGVTPGALQMLLDKGLIRIPEPEPAPQPRVETMEVPPITVSDAAHTVLQREAQLENALPQFAPTILEPSREEPLKVEPIQAEPAKVEPIIKAEPAKVESPKLEPAKVEPVKVEPVKVEPVKVEPVKVEPTKLEPTKLEPARVVSVKTEPAKVEPLKVEPAKVAPVKAAPVKAVPAMAILKKAIPAKTTPAKAAPVKSEPEKEPPILMEPFEITPFKPESSRTEPARQERQQEEKLAPKPQAPRAPAPFEVVPLVELETILGEATKMEVATILGVATMLELTPTQMRAPETAVKAPPPVEPSRLSPLAQGERDLYSLREAPEPKPVIPAAVLLSNLMAARAHLAAALDEFLEIDGYLLKQKVMACETRAELEALVPQLAAAFIKKMEKTAAKRLLSTAESMLDR